MIRDQLTFAFTSGYRFTRANLKGITQEESLQAPADGLNCVNWLAGHLLVSRGRAAQRMGAGSPILSDEEAKPYIKGSAGQLSAAEAIPLERIAEGLDALHQLIVAKLATMDDAAFEAPLDPALFPVPPEKPTLGASLQFILMHEAYHAGQIGTARKLMGKGSGLGV
jgi:hypothetical protein